MIARIQIVMADAAALPDTDSTALEQWAEGTGNQPADDCVHHAIGLAMSLVGACIAAVGAAHVVARFL